MRFPFYFLPRVLNMPLYGNKYQKGWFIMKRIYLYGFVDKSVVAYRYVREEYFSVRNIKLFMDDMLGDRPDIDHIYAVDNRPGLKADFMETIFKRRGFNFQEDISFEDMIAIEGILIFRR